MKARIIKVIETNLELRGNGIDTPFRRVTQYWSLEGKLLAEVDPWTDTETAQGGLSKVTHTS